MSFGLLLGFLPEASTMARPVDYLFWFCIAVLVFFTAIIFITIFYFAIRYRRRTPDEIPPQIHGNVPLEIVWTVIPMGIVAVMFVWGAAIFIRNARPPADAMTVYVTGKQWMWKIQHSNGKREIDALHVPEGVPIKLVMTSEDVIHDFSVPVFRVKKDVLPDHYTSIWFTADRLGKYRFYCDQYCGMGHSQMRGWLYVMTPAAYEAWLHHGVQAQTMAAAGALLYNRMGCVTCHGTGQGPPFAGLYGKTVKLADGTTAVANDAYLREMILYPGQKIVAGYRDIMPTFKGQLTEEEVLELIAYIKSLGSKPGNTGE
jgi:cytochrome c oxidase subunit 2